MFTLYFFCFSNPTVNETSTSCILSTNTVLLLLVVLIHVFDADYKFHCTGFWIANTRQEAFLHDQDDSSSEFIYFLGRFSVFLEFAHSLPCEVEGKHLVATFSFGKALRC